ncbi:MAG: alpha/beta hydrolase [Clostridiales bacterium]|nr:MAG: alpha/beta hydrolase [Clostridiales bacterium]
MKIIDGKIPFLEFETYYRIVNPNGKNTPLLMLHGGPGSTHNYLEVLDCIAEITDRPLVMYDQIGCGNSMVTGRPDLFTAETWMNELENLRKKLDLSTIHLFGQSWGGMLAIWYAIERKPKGIKSYILSSTLSDAKLWKKEQYRRISYMPKKMQDDIRYAIENNDYKHKGYLEALDYFMELYCDGKYGDNDPECLTRPKNRGSESYIVGWGHNEFSPSGTLKDYNFTDRLCEIKQPTLITSGQMDLSSPYIAKTMYDNLPNAKWELFAYSRHVPYIQENEKYVKVLSNWLVNND